MLVYVTISTFMSVNPSDPVLVVLPNPSCTYHKIAVIIVASYQISHQCFITSSASPKQLYTLAHLGYTFKAGSSKYL